MSVLCLALALAAVHASASTAAAAPGLDPHTPVSDDGRVGSRLQPHLTGGQVTGGQVTGDGFAGTGDLSAARGVRPVTGVEPPVVDPDGSSAQVIIWPDERVQVTDTTTYPARATVRFTYTKPNGSTSWCTGWLYAANAVATAGHCVHSGGTSGSWNTDFTVYPGRNGSSSPYGSCGVSDAHSVTGWTRDWNVQYDYATLKLTCTIGYATGWYGLNRSTAPLDGAAVSSSGYPRDKPWGTQWSTSGTVSATHARQLAYGLDTTSGQSGSAVYTTGCATYCAVAVHVYGYTTHNMGTRITAEVYDNLRDWAF